MERKELQKEVLKISEGLVESVTDLVLHSIFYYTEALEHPTMKTILTKAEWAADKDLAEINYQTLKRAILQLTNKGLIQKKKDKIIITNAGKVRLEKVLPSFGKDLSRSKGEIYLVSYDINENSRRGRDILRWWLKKYHAVMLQKSLFLIVSKFPEGLENLILEHGMEGEVLIIKLGKNSLIGGKLVGDYIKDIFCLDQLEQEYSKFIERFLKMNKQNLTPVILDFSFNRILKDDPNLPSEFLPEDWVGFKARDLYAKLRNNILTLRS